MVTIENKTNGGNEYRSVVTIDDRILNMSIQVTESMLYDAYNLNKNQFTSKHSVKPDSPLSIESVYRRLREYIVDQKLKIND